LYEEIYHAEEAARAEGYEAGFDDGRRLKDETRRIVHCAIKLCQENNLTYWSSMIDAVKAYNAKLDAITDPLPPEAGGPITVTDEAGCELAYA
ncbi:MAG: hypothetical protein FWC43_13175, partial [Planctomycetaceae bacterium]|nr:hypothetical protein [Planctomycetaceae bacterium]